MDKGIITISVPKGTTQEEVIAIRNKYKDKYRVNIVISGNSDPKEVIKNFLKARIET